MQSATAGPRACNRQPEYQPGQSLPTVAPVGRPLFGQRPDITLIARWFGAQEFPASPPWQAPALCVLPRRLVRQESHVPVWPGLALCPKRRT